MAISDGSGFECSEQDKVELQEGVHGNVVVLEARYSKCSWRGPTVVSEENETYLVV
jgi:hypothetical protein